MGKRNGFEPWQDIKRRMESAKAATQKPGGNLAGAASVQAPKLLKAPAVQSDANEKSANLFYTNPYNGGTMLTGVKPTITAPTVGNSLSGGTNSYMPVSGVKPVSIKAPKSIEQYQKEIAAKQNELEALHHQQYGAMLKGENTDEHDKLRMKHEAELKQLQTAYAQAMGIGYTKPKNQLLPDAQMSAKDEADFMAGFRKGLGLKNGEEIGRETTVSGLRDMGFEAQDVMAHRPGMDDDYPEPEPDFPKDWPKEDKPEEDSDVVHDIIEEFKGFVREHKWTPEEPESEKHDVKPSIDFGLAEDDEDTTSNDESSDLPETMSELKQSLVTYYGQTGADIFLQAFGYDLTASVLDAFIACKTIYQAGEALDKQMIKRVQIMADTINWGYTEQAYNTGELNGLPHFYGLNAPDEVSTYRNNYSNLQICATAFNFDWDNRVAGKTFEQLDEETIKWIAGMYYYIDGNTWVLDRQVEAGRDALK